MEEICPLLDHIRGIVYRRGVRLQCVFKPFDPLNTGTCTQTQFHRAIDSVGIRLVSEEVQIVCKAYASYEDEMPNTLQWTDVRPPRVNYAEFCTEIDRIFVTKGLEKRPDVTPTPSGFNLISACDYEAMSPENDARVCMLLDRLRLLIHTRGVSLADFYKHFDKLNHGFISHAQFKRGFPFTRETFTEEDLDLIARKFRANSGLINILAMHKEVCSPPSSPYLPFQTSPYTPTPNTNHWDHEKRPVEVKLQVALAVRRISMKEMFRDFDHLKKGVCTAHQARATLTTALNIPLSTDEWESLLCTYTTKDGFFDYERLCACVEEILTYSALDKFPLTRVNAVDAQELLRAQADRRKLTDHQTRDISELLARLRQRIFVLRKIVKPTFRDFDKRRTQHVTRLQLWRIMGMLELPVSEEEIDLLCLAFADKGNALEISYGDLLQHIEPHAVEVSDRTAPETIGSVYFTKDGRVVPLEETCRRKENLAAKLPQM